MNEKYVLAPLYHQLLDWFDNKGIYITIECDYDRSGKYNRGYTPSINGKYIFMDGDCFIYKIGALHEALTEAFKLI